MGTPNRWDGELMALGTRMRSASSGLTPGQVRLLKRHQRGLLMVAHVLAAKVGRAPTDLMFVIAHRESNVGRLAQEQLGGRLVAGSEAVVVPGLASELVTWLTRLALAGPVVDCTSASAGIAIIVIDHHDEMTLVRLQD